MEKDPVCGMSVDPSIAEFKSNYQGKTHYFCFEVCKQLFNCEPSKYIPSSGELAAHEHQ